MQRPQDKDFIKTKKLATSLEKAYEEIATSIDSRQIKKIQAAFSDLDRLVMEAEKHYKNVQSRQEQRNFEPRSDVNGDVLDEISSLIEERSSGHSSIAWRSVVKAIESGYHDIAINSKSFGVMADDPALSLLIRFSKSEEVDGSNKLVRLFQNEKFVRMLGKSDDYEQLATFIIDIVDERKGNFITDADSEGKSEKRGSAVSNLSDEQKKTIYEKILGNETIKRSLLNWATEDHTRSADEIINTCESHPFRIVSREETQATIDAIQRHDMTTTLTKNRLAAIIQRFEEVSPRVEHKKEADIPFNGIRGLEQWKNQR